MECLWRVVHQHDRIRRQSKTPSLVGKDNFTTGHRPQLFRRSANINPGLLNVDERHQYKQ